MKLPERLTTVTKFSKITALILFILLPFFWFFIGFRLGAKSGILNSIYCPPNQQIKNGAVQAPLYNQDQIKKVVTGTAFDYGLVQRPGMNIPVYNGTDYAGVVRKALGTTDWDEYLRVGSIPDSAKNNPYNLWPEEGGLYLLLVDQNGAGSGEGIAKLVRIDEEAATFETVKCFYFVPEQHTDLSLEQISQLDDENSGNCTNFDIELKR